ncbi:hypothetical protein [Micromonospora sp. RTGN7]|uniref:hypothetical protein n=1 Tax=Micromonospora sp. RTGN7 TaxID=3016526 RepID=UPI0029FED5FE|nr:hypothetical protein [Micromonospora sp. RTGN7]
MAGAELVSLRTLQRAFAVELTPTQAAADGDRARRAKLVYLRRAASYRIQVWEGDHKNLPIMVLPPRGPASTAWVTMFVDRCCAASSKVPASCPVRLSSSPPGYGTRLTIAGDTLTLNLAPGMLDHAARRRLNQLLHAHPMKNGVVPTEGLRR